MKHQEKSKQYSKQYSKKIVEVVKKWQKNNPEKVKEATIKYFNKKSRNLGFEPLNKPFENGEAHHINKTDVIYIPKELHESIPHCLETGKNMEEINKLAMGFIDFNKEVVIL